MRRPTQNDAPRVPESGRDSVRAQKCGFNNKKVLTLIPDKRKGEDDSPAVIHSLICDTDANHVGSRGQEEDDGKNNKVDVKALHSQKSASVDESRKVNSLGDASGRINAIQRQASLPVPTKTKRPLKQFKPFVRMNSDSDLHIQPFTQEEERVLETLDEIDLLHNIAKTPNILGSRIPSSGVAGDSTGGKPPPPAASSAAAAAALNAAASSEDKKKRLLVKQKSLNRTLSTSVLRIKKKRCAFWDT